MILALVAQKEVRLPCFVSVIRGCVLTVP